MANIQILEKNGQLLTTSLNVAEVFGKNHKDVMRDIRNILEKWEELGQRNFAPGSYFIESQYPDAQGQMRPMYLITKKGCARLVMGFTGADAEAFKVAYIEKFDEMEEAIKAAVKPMTETELVLWSAQRLVDLEREQKRQERMLLENTAELFAIKAKQDVFAAAIEKQKQKLEEMNGNSHYVSVIGFANQKGVKIDRKTAAVLGKAATLYCKEKGIQIAKTKHEAYGSVNIYPAEVLELIFKAHSLI